MALGSDERKRKGEEWGTKTPKEEGQLSLFTSRRSELIVWPGRTSEVNIKGVIRQAHTHTHQPLTLQTPNINKPCIHSLSLTPLSCFFHVSEACWPQGGEKVWKSPLICCYGTIEFHHRAHVRNNNNKKRSRSSGRHMKWVWKWLKVSVGLFVSQRVRALHSPNAHLMTASHLNPLNL